MRLELMNKINVRVIVFLYECIYAIVKACTCSNVNNYHGNFANLCMLMCTMYNACCYM